MGLRLSKKGVTDLKKVLLLHFGLKKKKKEKKREKKDEVKEEKKQKEVEKE